MQTMEKMIHLKPRVLAALQRLGAITLFVAPLVVFAAAGMVIHAHNKHIWTDGRPFLDAALFFLTGTVTMMFFWLLFAVMALCVIGVVGGFCVGSVVLARKVWPAPRGCD